MIPAIGALPIIAHKIDKVKKILQLGQSVTGAIISDAVPALALVGSPKTLASSLTRHGHVAWAFQVTEVSYTVGIRWQELPGYHPSRAARLLIGACVSRPCASTFGSGQLIPSEEARQSRVRQGLARYQTWFSGT
jgi:hypothetical protein